MQQQTLDRRSFLTLAGASVLSGCTMFRGNRENYSVSILGDTHFDADPREVYHAKWTPRHANDARDRANEFARNADMWRERLPKLIESAAAVRRPDTAFLLQMGDLIQGDCAEVALQLKMLEDAEKACRKGFEDIPFLTVCGNHDIRSDGGAAAYDEFIKPRARRMAGGSIEGATFHFAYGPDAFILVDFMRPDVERINAALDATEGARHTFFVCHSPVSPTDNWGAYWFLLGKPEDAEARRALFVRLLKRRAIVLCGHIHRTLVMDWVRPEGRLTQFAANSVWRPQEDKPTLLFDSPEQYGTWSRQHPPAMDEDHDGCLQKRTPAQMAALFGEYRAGLRRYRMLQAAGHYRLQVSEKSVMVAFYPCDARRPSDLITLRKNA